MKKHILLLSLFSLVTVFAHAQYIGVKAGLNMSNLNIDGVDNDNMRFGFHGGAFVNLPLGEAFAIQPEVLFSTKGSTAKYNFDLLGENISGKSTFKLNYLDIPIMGVLNIGDAAEIHFGPYIGILMSSSVSTEGDFGDANTDLDKDNFKKLDYGVAAGLAFNFDLLQVGARYNYGLQKIGDSDAATVLGLDDATNSYLQVFAAIRIGSY